MYHSELGVRIEEVNLSKIEPIYIESVSRKEISRKIEFLNRRKNFDILIVVEHEPTNDKYYLVSGYPEYLAYKKWNQVEKILCKIQLISDKTVQRIKLLTRIFDYQRNPWIDKHNLIQYLVDNEKSVKEIADTLRLDTQDVQRYLIHWDIPDDIIKLGLQNEASFPNLDQIRRLKLPYLIIRRLYMRAVRPKRDPERLTGEKLQKIKWLINLNQFDALLKDRKWNLIESALDYKTTLQELWQLKIFQYLNIVTNKEFTSRDYFYPLSQGDHRFENKGDQLS